MTLFSPEQYPPCNMSTNLPFIKQMHVHIYYDFIVSAALNLEFSEDKIFLYMSKQTGQNKSSLYRTNACVYFIVHAALILEFSQNKFFLHMPKQTQQNVQS